MHKILFITSVFFVSLMLLNVVSAQEIWSFDNFVNNYRVYKSAICNVDGTRSCPNELGWQGKKISFKFLLNETISENVSFFFGVNYFINEKPIDVYVNGKKVASNLVVDGRGAYAVDFPSSLLKQGKKNKISITMKNVKVGYGKPAQGFVLSYARLENNDGPLVIPIPQ